jgi:hypothetical protein
VINYPAAFIAKMEKSRKSRSVIGASQENKRCWQLDFAGGLSAGVQCLFAIPLPY